MEFQFNNEQPIWLQIAATLEQAIFSGEYSAGDRLPSVREIALLSKSNPNTVSKALLELERKGLIETRRTAGKFVSNNLDIQKSQKKKRAVQNALNYLDAQHQLGYSNEEAMRFLTEILRDNNHL